MKQLTPDRYSRTIVILGDFNPKIYQPAWFAAEKLIGKQEAEQAKVEIIHPDVSIFSIEWLRVEVLRERFVAEITQQLFDKPLRDLVLGTFSILRHTPVRVMGINTSVHVRVASIDAWGQAGHRMAPIDVWSDVLDSPTMMRVQMREMKRRDGRPGFIDVRVEPSGKVKPGLFFAVNDHYECSQKSTPGCEEILAVLDKNWTDATARAENIIGTLFERVTA